MQIKRLIYALVPIIALSPSAIANTEGESDDNGIVISKRETTATPGGFSGLFAFEGVGVVGGVGRVVAG